MAICKHADLKAIEFHQPLGLENEESEDYPFKITVGEGGKTVICFGEEWCNLLLNNQCPKYTSDEIIQ